MSDLVWLETCGSTNDEAARYRGQARAVAADTQTQGRGRRGRRWVSPPRCGLYLSWIVTPAVPPEQGMALPLLAAVATAELCVELGVTPALKWPNDLLLDGRKLAGILCEAHVEGARWQATVGVGLNVKRPPGGYPEDVPAVALDEIVEPPSPRALAPRLLARLEAWHQRLAAEGLPRLLDAWRARGPQTPVRMRQGGVEGTYAGLGPTGALLLDTAAGRREIVGGEVDVIGVST